MSGRLWGCLSGPGGLGLRDLGHQGRVGSRALGSGSAVWDQLGREMNDFGAANYSFLGELVCVLA